MRVEKENYIPIIQVAKNLKTSVYEICKIAEELRKFKLYGFIDYAIEIQPKFVFLKALGVDPDISRGDPHFYPKTIKNRCVPVAYRDIDYALIQGDAPSDSLLLRRTSVVINRIRYEFPDKGRRFSLYDLYIEKKEIGSVNTSLFGKKTGSHSKKRRDILKGVFENIIHQNMDDIYKTRKNKREYCAVAIGEKAFDELQETQPDFFCCWDGRPRRGDGRRYTKEQAEKYVKTINNKKTRTD